MQSILLKKNQNNEWKYFKWKLEISSMIFGVVVGTFLTDATLTEKYKYFNKICDIRIDTELSKFLYICNIILNDQNGWLNIILFYILKLALKIKKQRVLKILLDLINKQNSTYKIW